MLRVDAMIELRKLWYWLILCLTVVFGLLYAGRRDFYTRYRDYQAGRAAVAAAELQCQALEQAVGDMRQRVTDLENNPFAMEAATRNSKGFVRPDEVVYRLEEAPTEAP